VANADFEGGCDGRGRGVGTFLVRQAQPSHVITITITVARYNPNPNLSYNKAARKAKTPCLVPAGIAGFVSRSWFPHL
jgi:hypothetical protein